MIKVISILLSVIAFSAQASPIKVALVLDKGGKDDKSFNAAAFAGATKAQSDLGITLKAVETTDDTAVENTFRSFAGKDFDLIIGIGFAQAEALKKVASAFPNKHFAIVDADVNLPNVRSLLFEEHQGSFLVGALAAMISKSGKIGFIGGMDVPLIRRFQMGFEAGVKKVNPKAILSTNYVGVTSDSWNNPAKSKELALTQYGAGTDIIFAAAGASNSGVFDAAEEKKQFVIGVDSNQNWVKPGRVLTSMLKRVDLAVFAAIQDTMQGKFTAGATRFGLKNRGVDYAVDQYNESLISASTQKKMQVLKAEIISGKIIVPDYYKLNGKK